MQEPLSSRIVEKILIKNNANIAIFHDMLKAV